MPRKMVAKRKGRSRKTGTLKKTAPPKKPRRQGGAKPKKPKGKGAPKDVVEGMTERYALPEEMVPMLDEVYRSLEVPKKRKRTR